MMRQGGTMLGTTIKGNPFAYPMPNGTVKDRSGEVIEGIRSLGLDAVICIGGDGSFAILSKLLGDKIPFVAIPKTIDNDVAQTELSIGFRTAASIATEALDRLQPTAASHDRVMVLEVMGRDAGHIALEAGIAGGADVILLPEFQWNIGAVARKIAAVREGGRNFALVVVSEAAATLEGRRLQKEVVSGQKRYGGIGEYVAHLIAEATGAETRVTVLGHVQRGCPPAHTDRLIAQSFGVHAVDMLADGKFGRMVAWRDRQVSDVSIADAIATYQAVDPDSSLVRTARALGICLGDS
jgi:6-phosphofructokinase 1